MGTHAEEHRKDGHGKNQQHGIEGALAPIAHLEPVEGKGSMLNSPRMRLAYSQKVQMLISIRANSEHRHEVVVHGGRPRRSSGRQQRTESRPTMKRPRF